MCLPCFTSHLTLILSERVTVELIIYRSKLFMLHSLVSDSPLRHEVFIVQHFSRLPHIRLVFRQRYGLTGHAGLIKKFFRSCSQVCILLIGPQKKVFVWILFARHWSLCVILLGGHRRNISRFPCRVAQHTHWFSTSWIFVLFAKISNAGRFELILIIKGFSVSVNSDRSTRSALF